MKVKKKLKGIVCCVGVDKVDGYFIFSSAFLEIAQKKLIEETTFSKF